MLRRRGADGRSKGRSSFDPTRVPARPYYSARIHGRKLPVPRYNGYCDARNTYLYRKCVLFHRPRQRVQRIDRPVLCPRSAFCIFHFRGDGRERGGGAPEALQNAISGLGCWSDFSSRTRSEGGRMPGIQCVFGSTSIGRRVSTKGKESLVSVTQNGFRVINATNRARSSRVVTR